MRSCQIHCQSNSKFKGNHTSLSFADLEETTEQNLEEEPQEHLVLFLQMAYTAHINNQMANNVNGRGSKGSASRCYAGSQQQL